MTRSDRAGFVRELTSSRTLRKMLGLYVAISLVLFVVLLSVFCFQLTERMHQDRLRGARATLDTAEQMNDHYVRSIINYGIQSLDDYEVRGLLYSNDFSSYLSINSRNIYNQVAGISGLLANVQFVNNNTRTVLDSNGRYSFDVYADEALLAWLETMSPSPRTPVYFHPRLMNQSSRLHPSERLVVSTVYYLNRNGALVLNFDYDAYKALVFPRGEMEHTQCYIVNQQQTLFCATQDGLVDDSLAFDTEILHAVQDQQADRGVFTAADGRAVTYRKNALLGLTYYAVIERPKLFSDIGATHAILLMAAVFLAASLLVSYLLAVASSLPILRLHRNVRTHMPAEWSPQEVNQDEIAYLSQAYRQVITANQELTEQTQTHQREKENWQLLHLMNLDSNPTHAASVTAVDELSAQFTEPDFVVIALLPNRQMAAATTGGQELRLRLANLAASMLADFGALRVVFPVSFQVLMVLNTDLGKQREALNARLGDLLSRCKESLNDSTQYLGVGTPVQALSDIADSFSGAMEALQYAHRMQNSQPCWAESLVMQPASSEHYPYDVDAELMKAVKHQQLSQAEAYVEAFFQRISAFHHSQYLRTMLQLDAAFQRLENSLQLPSDYVADTSVITHWNLEEAKQHFIARVRLDISQQASQRRDRADNGQLIERINQLIEERIDDPSLSVTQLADELSFSVNYLRSLYKAGTGETLSSYITSRRVAAACRLLDETDAPVEQITERLGFSSRNYFFTFFKNHVGMTPTQYRTRDKGADAST